MGADFYIRGDTKLDSSGFSKGIQKLGSVAKKGAEKMQSSFQGATGALDKVKSGIFGVGSSLSTFKKKADEARAYTDKLKSTLKETEQEVGTLSERYRLSVMQTGRYSKETQSLAKKLEDTKQRQADLSDELEKSSFAVQKYGFNLNKLGAALTTSIKLAAASALGAVLTLGKIGYDYNTQMETYTTNFEVMLGSTEAAVKRVNELKDFAAKTPFGMEDLANATQTLLAFQVPAEETTGIMKMLGDISLGNAANFQSLALVFGQISSAGKLTGQDLMQFINAGFNPLNYIAIETGESMEELRKRMEKGAIGVDEVKRAFELATSEGGQFFQGMEKGSQTTKGLLSTFQDIVKSKLGDLFANVSNKIKELLPNVISFVEGIDVSSIIQGLKNLYDKFVELSPVILSLTAAVLTFRTAVTIGNVIEGTAKSLNTFKTAQNAATLAQAAFNAVMNANPFILVTTLVVGLVTALVTLWHTNEDFRNAVLEIWGNIVNFFVTAWDMIVSVWNSAVDFFIGIWDSIVNFSKICADSIVNFFVTAWDMIVFVWDSAVDFFAGIWNGIVVVFSYVVSFFTNCFGMAWTAIQAIWNNVTGYFSAIWETIKGIFSVVSAVLSGNFSDAWEAIKGIVETWVGYFQSVWENIKAVFSSVGEYFLSVGRNIVNGIKNGIASVWDGLVSWFNGLWDSLFGRKTINVDVKASGGGGSSRGGGAGRKTLQVDGSHRLGLNRVPYDGYIAELHKGEMVLTSQQAGLWRSGIVQQMLSEAYSVMRANQSRTPVLATAGAPAISRQMAATVQTQHTTVIDMDGRTVAKVITPFVDQFLF